MKLALILLAAGDSRRFDGNKLLYEFYGKPMYRYIVEEVEKLPTDFFCRKLVVTQYEEIMDYMGSHGYEVVENKESSLGISHSIHLALKALEGEDAALCFAVCDQPYLKAATIKALAEGWQASGKGIGCLCNMGEFGNPAIFSQDYREELLMLKGDVGGKRVIRSHIGDLYLHEVSDSLELVDIDVRNIPGMGRKP
ncbi:nucleotidyltransferase family protein [Lacrimispora sp.]|uniref:nucleotidyltransferase family protein n=1 Tax=Lacrimispora sp. TaxID=2719234 RepID=UPI002FDAC519